MFGADQPLPLDCGVDLAPFQRVMRVYDSCMSLSAFAEAHPARQPDAE